MTKILLEEGLAINIADAKHDFKSIKGDKLIKIVESISPMPLRPGIQIERKGFEDPSNGPIEKYKEIWKNEDWMLASEFFTDAKNPEFDKIKLNIGMEGLDESIHKYLWTRSKINTVSPQNNYIISQNNNKSFTDDYNIVLFSKSKFPYLQKKCSSDGCDKSSVTVQKEIMDLNNLLNKCTDRLGDLQVKEVCQNHNGYQENLNMSKQIDEKAAEVYELIKKNVTVDDNHDKYIYVLSILAKELNIDTKCYYNLKNGTTPPTYKITNKDKIKELYNALKYCLVFSSTRKSEIDSTLTRNDIDKKQNINIICDVQLNAFRDLKNTSAVETDRTYFWLQNTQTMLDPAGKTTAYTDTGKNAGFDLDEDKSNFRFAYETLDQTFYGYNTWPLKAGTKAELKDYADEAVTYDTMLTNKNTCFMFPVNKNKSNTNHPNNYQDHDTVFYMEVLDKNGKSQTPKAYAYANSDISKINSSNKSNNSDYKKICQKEFEERFSKSGSNNSIFKRLFNKIKNNAKYKIANPSLEHHVQAKKFGDGAQALRCVQGTTNVGLINTDRKGVGSDSAGLGHDLLDTTQGQGVLKTSGYNMFISHDRIAILQALKFKADIILMEQKYGGVLFIKKSCQKSSSKVKNLISYIELYNIHKVKSNNSVITNFDYIYNNQETKKTIDYSYTGGVLKYIDLINNELISMLKKLNRQDPREDNKCYTYCKRWKDLYKNVHEIEPSTVRKPNSGVSMLVVYEEIYKHFLLYYAIIFNLVTLYNTIQTTVYNNKYTIEILDGQLNTIIGEIKKVLNHMLTNMNGPPGLEPPPSHALINIVTKAKDLATTMSLAQSNDITSLIKKYNDYHTIILDIYKILWNPGQTDEFITYLDVSGRNFAVKLSEVITEFYNYYFKLDTVLETNKDLIVSFIGQVGLKRYLTDQRKAETLNNKISEILKTATMILPESGMAYDGADLWGMNATGGKCDYKIKYTKEHQHTISKVIEDLHITPDINNEFNYFNFIHTYMTDEDFMIGKYGFLNRFQLFNLVPQSMMYNISNIDINSLGYSNIKLVNNSSTPYNYLDKFFGIYTVLNPIMKVLTRAFSDKLGAESFEEAIALANTDIKSNKTGSDKLYKSIKNAAAADLAGNTKSGFISQVNEILGLISTGINKYAKDTNKIGPILVEFNTEIKKILTPSSVPAPSGDAGEGPVRSGGGKPEDINKAINKINGQISPQLKGHSEAKAYQGVSVNAADSPIYNYILKTDINIDDFKDLYKFILNYYNELENIQSYYDSNASKYIENDSLIPNPKYQILFKKTVNPDAAADMAFPHDINKIIIALNQYFININNITSVSVYICLQKYFGFFPLKQNNWTHHTETNKNQNLLEKIVSFFAKQLPEQYKSEFLKYIQPDEVTDDINDIITKCIDICKKIEPRLSDKTGVVPREDVASLNVEVACYNQLIQVQSLIDIIRVELVDVISYIFINNYIGENDYLDENFYYDLNNTVNKDGIINTTKGDVIPKYTEYIININVDNPTVEGEVRNNVTDIISLATAILSNKKECIQLLPLIETNIISIVEDNYGEEKNAPPRVPSMFIYDALEIQFNSSDKYDDIVCIKQLKNEQYVNEPDYYSHYVEVKIDKSGPPGDGGGSPGDNLLLEPIVGHKRKDRGGGKVNNPLKKAFDLMTNFNKLLFKTNENGSQEIDHEKIKYLANLQYIILNNKHYYNAPDSDPTQTRVSTDVVKSVEEKQSLEEETDAEGLMSKMFGPAFKELLNSASKTAKTASRAAAKISSTIPSTPKSGMLGGKKSRINKRTRKIQKKKKGRRFTYKK